MTMRLVTPPSAVVDWVDNHVRMYVCGITPYDSTHLGHAATYLTYDHYSKTRGSWPHRGDGENVTDVDDSILPKNGNLESISFN